MDLHALPVAEFAFPGPLRDRLVSRILAGTKTATTGLRLEYDRDGDPLPRPGALNVLIDSAGRRVAVLETTEVREVLLGDVLLEHAQGEGHETLAEWRTGHERFWHSEEMRAELGDPAFTVDDTTPVVLERFRVVRLLDAPGVSEP